ncbi:winged helix-turn-helix domain-containing protein [Plesiomonas sp.]|uniref:winged helix-turn-helix domain-containing protein n=1 Tax=Plesiomonas sp. TaxID=2486279 RepID=UPI003F2FE03A
MKKAYQVRNILINSEKTLLLDTESNKEFKIGKHDFMTLLELASNAGTVLSKEHLLEKCWPGKIVAESSITQAISNIRSLIGDNGKEQKWLKTISKTGYKLDVSAVTVVSEDSIKNSSDHIFIDKKTTSLFNENANMKFSDRESNKNIDKHIINSESKTTLLQVVFTLMFFFLCLMAIHYHSKIESHSGKITSVIYTDTLTSVIPENQDFTSDRRYLIKKEDKNKKQDPLIINILLMNDNFSFFIIENNELTHNKTNNSSKESVDKLINDTMYNISV